MMPKSDALGNDSELVYMIFMIRVKHVYELSHITTSPILEKLLNYSTIVTFEVK